jgi:hypothetical protein
MIDGRPAGRVDAARLDALLDDGSDVKLYLSRAMPPPGRSGADEVAAAVRRRSRSARDRYRAGSQRQPRHDVAGAAAGGGDRGRPDRLWPGHRRRTFRRCSTPASATHPKAVGLVEDIPFFARQTRLTFARCGVIDPLDLASYEAHGGSGRAAPGAAR